MSVKKYKELFGLPHNLSLMDNKTLNKKQKAFNERRNHYIKNLSKKHQFKKGENRHNKYFSELEKNNLIKRVNEKKVLGECPICKTKYDHLYSHLYNKHKLLYTGEIQ